MTAMSVSMQETSESPEFWLAQGVASGLEAAIRSADIVILPARAGGQEGAAAFHQDTPALYQFLLAEVGDLKVELCATEEEYLELALHSNTIRLSGVFVQWVVAPLLVGLLTNYLYDELKVQPTDKVEMAVIVQDHQCKSFKFEFKGDAKDLNALADKVGQLARDCEKATGKTVQARKKK